MKNHSGNELKLQEINALEDQITELRTEQADIQKQIKELLFTEDIKAGITFETDIFTLQQSKLRIDTEIQFAQARIGRLKISL